MGTISKRPSGRYQAQTISFGKRITKTFPRLADAKRWISQIEADNDAGLPPESRLTVGEQLVKYRTLVSERRIHWRHECAVIGCFLDDPISEVTISCVSPRDVEAWIERRRTIPSRNTGRLVEESTIARQLQTLSAFFSWAVKQNLLKENPCLKVNKPSGSVARERVATDEEIERLKLVAGWDEKTPPENKMQRVCAAFILACCTGMRAGEMMRIERSWIHGRTLKIPAEAAKTRTAREIALNNRALNILSLVMSLGFSPTIWDLSDGIRDALWRKIRDKAGLHEERDSAGRLIIHDGRATFATLARPPVTDC